jgi:hypothetical protein
MIGNFYTWGYLKQGANALAVRLPVVDVMLINML